MIQMVGNFTPLLYITLRLLLFSSSYSVKDTIYYVTA